MSPNKTLYIRDDDMSIWERAEQLTKRTRQSLSQLVTDALRRYIADQNKTSTGDQAFEEITVDVGEPVIATTFDGRWLVAPDPDETRTREPGYEAGTYWGVALTKRRRIALYVAHCNDRWPAMLLDFDALTDVSKDDLPDDIRQLAAAELGQRTTVRRDI